MQTQKTQEEILASRIKPRNYSDILAIIHSLRARSKKDYFPSVYPSTLIVGNVGFSLGGVNSVGTFSALMNADGVVKSTFAVGESIKFTGFASYVQVANGVTSTKVAPFIEAHFGLNAQGKAVLTNGNQAIPHEIIQCEGIDKQSNGQYQFIIKTDNLEAGKYFAFIDACSPGGTAVRLFASGTSQDTSSPNFLQTYNVRSFDIIGPTPRIGIFQQPIGGIDFYEGNALEFAIKATAETYPKLREGTNDYQWQFSTDNVNWTSDFNRDKLNARDREKMSFEGKVSDSGYYRCILSNSAGSVTSNSVQLIVSPTPPPTP